MKINWIKNMVEKVTVDRIETIAKARTETVEQVKSRFSKLQLGLAPRSFSKHIPALREMEFVETGVSDGMAYAKLHDGHTFYGFKSMPNHRRAFEFVKDLLAPEINEDTFLVALDVVQRFATNFTWPPEEITPPKDGIVVECGAYLGHKTIRFAEELVPDGKVLAIEMMPENVKILKKNIEANNLQHRIDVMEFGVWNESGELEVRGKGRQRNTLVDLDKLSDDTGVMARVETLDNILDSWGQNRVDLLFITVNGAEVESIAGLNQWLQRVRGIFVAAPYERDGQKCSDICRNLLKEKGCEILDTTNSNRVIATSNVNN